MKTEKNERSLQLFGMNFLLAWLSRLQAVILEKWTAVLVQRLEPESSFYITIAHLPVCYI